VTAAEKADAPTDLTVSTERDSNQNRDQKVLNFDKDTTNLKINGGSEITGYNVFTAPADEVNPTANPDKWFRKTFTAADNGWIANNVYFWGWELSAPSNVIWLTAINSIGESDPSETVQALWLCPKCNLGDYKCYGR